MRRKTPEGDAGGARREFGEADFAFNSRYYAISGRVLDILTRVLKVNIALHAERSEVAAGDVFLFNHFARFETFIPPYLIYRQAGSMCRTVASPAFFYGNDAASKLLRGLGAVPADYPNLFPFLAAEIIRGHKVIVFPEGGMVKDRRVVDRKGRYSIYSRLASERRKHHVGASVIAQGLEIFREAVLKARKRGDDRLLALWASRVGPDANTGREKLNAFSERDLRVVPANITFYPIRVDPNLLERWAGTVGGTGLPERLREELRIEGNILLKDTDMDIRLGKPSSPGDDWTSVDRVALDLLIGQVESIEDAFDLLRTGGGGALGELVAKRANHLIFSLRDRYMREIYAAVSVNLSQLAASAMFKLMEEERDTVEAQEFHRIVYLALKRLQPRAEVALHRSLVDPEQYEGIEEGHCRGFAEFMHVAKELGLVEEREGAYRFSEKLTGEAEFDHIRVENPIAVYANEVRPLSEVAEAVAQAIREGKKTGGAKLASLRFDDELVSYRFDKFRFSKAKYREMNDRQAVTADSRPYLLRPETPRGTGIILVHGFGASPAEMRPLADYLYNLGFAVLGIRLKGHGTSPWDMKERNRHDWERSVARARRIMAGICERYAMVGFSMGGLLALGSAARSAEGLAGVVSVSAPVKLKKDPRVLVEFVHHVNRFVGLMTHEKGVMPFHHTSPENPEVNYRDIPVGAVHELEHLMKETGEALHSIAVPALIVQGDADPRVEPVSANAIYDRISSRDKVLTMVRSDVHGIVYRNSGGCHRLIADWLERLP